MDIISNKIGILALFLTMLGISASPHPFVLIFTYLIHELGHIIFATHLGARLKKFKIGAFKLCISYDTSELSYLKELLVCFGGIVFNLISAIIVAILPIFKGEVSDFFIICNFSLAIMNLYPISVLDGGGILRSTLMIITNEEKSEKICRGVSLICVLIMWLASVYLQLVFSSNLSMFFISVVLLIEFCFSLIK
ncbi:MAG: site-2 protease family protein [Clostridia bacterium]|nr:site-2 protease family protein [Clostridia bacterium]MBQ7789047.1 site-2 protease family protein [Clostridia bacterium]